MSGIRTVAIRARLRGDGTTAMIAPVHTGGMR